MSAEEVGKLFEPFYTTKPRGTGLGLTVVSRVVEQNGGRVGVRSAPGEGTTFSLVLPVAGAQ
jgi:signal transduction histidine kinase